MLQISSCQLASPSGSCACCAGPLSPESTIPRFFMRYIRVCMDHDVGSVNSATCSQTPRKVPSCERGNGSGGGLPSRRASQEQHSRGSRGSRPPMCRVAGLAPSSRKLLSESQSTRPTIGAGIHPREHARPQDGRAADQTGGRVSAPHR